MSKLAFLNQIGTAVAIVLATASVAHAQDLLASAPDVVKREMNEAVKPTKATEKVGQSTLESTVSTPGGVELQRDEDASQIVLKYSMKFNGLPTAPGVTRFFSLTAKAPLDEDDENSGVLGTLKGLGDATSVELKYTYSQLKGLNADADSLRLAAEMGMALCPQIEARAIAAEGKKPDDIDCSMKRLPGKYVNKYASKEDYRRYVEVVIDRRARIDSWGLSGAVGTKTFKYLDPNTLAEIEDRETPWSVGVYAARQWLGSRMLVVAKFEHKELYEEADEENRCPTPGQTTNCVKGRFGPPEQKKVDLASLELRQRIGDIGFSLTGAYDVGEDSVALELPVYFVRTDKGLTGGVRAAWDSKSDEVVVGLFITQPLSVSDL
jgi:hypothetical protein